MTLEKSRFTFGLLQRPARLRIPILVRRASGRLARGLLHCAGMVWRIPPARSRRSPPTGFIHPCRPTLVAQPPAGPRWLHEMKHDGYRLLARKQGGRVSLWSRHGYDLHRQVAQDCGGGARPGRRERAHRRRSPSVPMVGATSGRCAPRPATQCSLRHSG
jgi:hypothetical protein